MSQIKVTITTTPKIVPSSTVEEQYLFTLSKGSASGPVVQSKLTDLLEVVFDNVSEGEYLVTCTKNGESVYSPVITIGPATKTIAIPFELFSSVV